MGILLVQIFVFLCGISAIVFSILAWRLKKDIFFYLGIGFTAIYCIYAAYNIEFLMSLLNYGDMLFLLFNLSFIIIPAYFLISSKINSKDSSFDEAKAGGPVTEEYLDEIINSPEEEVDFEDDYDLK